MGCQWTHSDHFPCSPLDLLQLSLFLFPHCRHLALISTLRRQQISTIVKHSLDVIDTMAPCLRRVIMFAASPFVSLWIRRLRAAPSSPSPLAYFGALFQRESTIFIWPSVAGCCLHFALRMSLQGPIFSCKICRTIQEVRTANRRNGCPLTTLLLTYRSDPLIACSRF